MKVVNYPEALLQEQNRRRKEGSFGYGDFGLRNSENVDLGSAAADRILEEATASWTDEQLANAKADWREMILNLNNAVKSRNEVIEAIRQMSEGNDKGIAIGQFNDVDSVFMQAYAEAAPLLQKIGVHTGDTFPTAQSAQFGLAPLAIWGLVAASLTAVAYISTAMYDSKLKYEAIKENPSVAKYLPSGGLSNLLGTDISTKLVYGGLAIVAGYILLKKFL